MTYDSPKQNEPLKMTYVSLWGNYTWLAKSYELRVKSLDQEVWFILRAKLNQIKLKCPNLNKIRAQPHKFR